MNEPRYFLRRGIGAWSSGTQIEIVDTNHESGLLVRVLAGDKPLIEVSEKDIVIRGKAKAKQQEN